MNLRNNNYICNWRHQAFMCAIFALALLTLSSSPLQAQVPNLLRFSTDGAGSSSYGDASSSDGAWRGNIKFRFNGSISNGILNLSTGSIEIRLPQTPSGTKFYWLKDSGWYGSINRPGDYPVVTYVTTDRTYNVLTISNLKGYEDYSNTNARWDGRIKVTLKFSKVAGVADRFRVEFTPTAGQYSPPPAVSGLIASAVVKSGSNLTVR